jgi:hypothetical protein
MPAQGHRARTRRIQWSLLAGAVAALLLTVLMPGVGQAAVSVSRAEVQGDRLRIEGTAASNRSITVDGVAMGTSDGSGQFRIERSGFSAPTDCTVDVNDGSATATTARLSGCTVSSPPPAPSLAALGLSASTVVGGTPVTGTVTLTSAAATEGFVIALTSDNTVAATVPPSVTVAAGSASATFTVTTNPVTNSQSSIIIGTAGGVTRHAVLTVVTQFEADNGSISLARGGSGEGRVTSQPAGIDCTFTRTGTIGTCGNVFLPAGTQVRLDARPAAGSQFLGWDFEVSCRDAPNVTVVAGVAHICRPVFRLQ